MYAFIEANANQESRIPREQLAEVAQVNRTVRQYLVELEQQNPTEEPVHEPQQASLQFWGRRESHDPNLALGRTL